MPSSKITEPLISKASVMNEKRNKIKKAKIASSLE
jgi:hypothetical protein